MVLGFIGLIVYALISDYRPEEKEVISRPDNPSLLKDSTVYSLLTWNIGYAVLDKGMDLFKDGGTKVITPEENFQQNNSAIKDFLTDNNMTDFILIQEIDRKSKRSYHTDQ